MLFIDNCVIIHDEVKIMNPMNVIKLKSLLERFNSNHPKVPMFFKAAAGSVQEGSIIEIKVVSPDSKNHRNEGTR